LRMRMPAGAAGSALALVVRRVVTMWNVPVRRCAVARRF
jgi:hypothetical protein